MKGELSENELRYKAEAYLAFKLLSHNPFL